MPFTDKEKKRYFLRGTKDDNYHRYTTIKKPKSRNIIENIPKLDIAKFKTSPIPIEESDLNAEQNYKKNKRNEETSDYIDDEGTLKDANYGEAEELKFPISVDRTKTKRKGRSKKKKEEKVDYWNEKIQNDGTISRTKREGYNLRPRKKIENKDNATEYEQEQDMYENFKNYTNGTQEDEPFYNKTRRYLEKGYNYFNKIAKIIHGAGQIYGAYNLIRNFANRPRENIMEMDEPFPENQPNMPQEPPINDGL